MKEAQYRQTLTPEEASKGIHVARENSRSLLNDAILLFDNDRFERATALAILAIEEAGKLSIIRTILLENDPKLIADGWRAYRKHTAKNLSWILPDVVRDGARQLDDFTRIYDEKSEHGYVLDNLKQLAFYTDCFRKCRWSIPKDVITKEIANMILNTAKVLVEKGNSIMTSKEELEIYLKHVKPVWRGEMIKMKQALVECYAEAEREGLLEPGTTKRMSDFVL